MDLQKSINAKKTILLQVFLIFASTQSLKKQCTPCRNSPSSSVLFLHQLHLHPGEKGNKYRVGWSHRVQVPEAGLRVHSETQGWCKARDETLGKGDAFFPLDGENATPDFPLFQELLSPSTASRRTCASFLIWLYSSSCNFPRVSVYSCHPSY